jgi:hypothetical protein
MSTAFRVGVLVVMALVFLSIGVFLIGNKDFLFSSTYRLKAEFQNVAGLNNGAAVRIGGIHQGTVKEIDLPSQPDGKVTVVMNVKSETRNIIKKDSRASIKTEGLLGDKYVEISFGSPKADPMAKTGTIASESREICRNRRNRSRMKLALELSPSATTWKLSSTISFSVDFSKDADTVIALIEPARYPRIPARKPSKEFQFDAKEVFDKPDNAKLKDKKTSMRRKVSRRKPVWSCGCRLVGGKGRYGEAPRANCGSRKGGARLPD